MTIDQDAIRRAYAAIAPHIRRTPILEIDRSELGLAPGPLVLKLELTQHAGAFKTRGAFANLLLRDVPPAGVAAASGGNHGAATAYAAMKLGRPARIFVPEISSPAKVARIRDYGAQLVVGGAAYADARAACDAYCAETGALDVPAFDGPWTMMGAGTLGLELEGQASVDTVLVGVGGGGLIGGLAGWYGGRVKLVGFEPENSPTLHEALAAGEPVDVPVSGVAADSLGARRLGAAVFPLARAHVAAGLLVSDEAIRAAQRLAWDRLRIVVEPGSAAALAGLAFGAYQPQPDERVAVILSGANTTAVDFDR